MAFVKYIQRSYIEVSVRWTTATGRPADRFTGTATRRVRYNRVAPAQACSRATSDGQPLRVPPGGSSKSTPAAEVTLRTFESDPIDARTAWSPRTT